MVRLRIVMPAIRADAVRNQQAVLHAADELFAEAGSWDVVSINAVAERAGVGKGTVFRGFGDRAGLLRAVMARRSDRLVELLDQPGDLAALFDEIVSVKLANRSLSLALEGSGSGSPYRAELYDRTHAVVSAALAGRPDPGFAAHALLAAVRSDLIEHLLATGTTEAQLRAQVAAFVRGVAGSARP